MALSLGPRRVISSVILLVAVAVPAAGQTVDEQALLARLGEQPTDLAARIALTKLYYEQARLEAARRSLDRAVGLVAETARRAGQVIPVQPTPEQVERQRGLEDRVESETNAVAAMLDLAQLHFTLRRYETAERSLWEANRGFVGRPMLAPSAMPTAPPVRVGDDIKAPSKARDVRPVYPQVAQRLKAGGFVIIEAVIGKSGAVTRTEILRSLGEIARAEGRSDEYVAAAAALDAAAEDAVRQWRYTPTLQDGEPVEVMMTVTVNFTIGRSPRIQQYQ